MAIKLTSDIKKFMDVVGGSGDIMADMEKFCIIFFPLLEENLKFLVRFHVLSNLRNFQLGLEFFQD